jgi:putative multiple sugar transport system substrate-binding protein
MRRQLFLRLGVAAGALLLAAASPAQDKGTVGVSMPTKSSARWIDDGNNMVKVLKEKGYKADLQYAEDDIPNQLAQVENMITKKVKVLVIAAIDGTTLSNALQKAADKGIKVIAYDRLIRGSKNVDYYTTFDNFQVGVLQAGSIVDKLGLKQGKGPFNIELFGGSPDDNNAFFFYDGAMSVLKPYLDSGKLVVRSKQMGMDKVGTLRWDGAVAQARMDNLLSAYYGNARVDAGALAVRRAVDRHPVLAQGRGLLARRSSLPGRHGQDAEVPSVKSMLRGEQTSTVFKDTRELAQGHREHDRRDAVGKQPRSTTPRPTTTASRWCPRTCSSRSASTSPTGRSAWSTAATTRSRRSSEAAAARAMACWRCAASRSAFHGVDALSDVNLAVRAGEIHAVVGENGAGKSTLMKVLSGVYPHGSYDGAIVFDGQERRFGGIADSERAGIIIIHQELALVPLLSIAENIFLGNERARGGVIDWFDAPRTQALLSKVGLKERRPRWSPTSASASSSWWRSPRRCPRRCRLLILDEPTASLNETDSDALLALLLELKSHGIACILISHKLNEVAKVADTITVIRDGSTVRTLDAAPAGARGRGDPPMVGPRDGRPLPEAHAADRRDGVRGARLARAPPDARRPAVDQGREPARAARRDRRHRRLMGAGRTELAMSVFGRSYGQRISGRVRLHGRETDVSTVGKAVASGIAYVTEDRKATASA